MPRLARERASRDRPWAAPVGAPLLAAALVVAQGAGAQTVEEGAGAYKQFCSHCHGIDMVNPGTSSYDLRRYPQDARDAFIDTLIHGKGDMPAWGDLLYPEEMEALWVYVATRGGKEPLPEGAAPAAAPDDASAAPEAERVDPASLTVCLAKNGGAMSQRRSRGGAGFDHAVAEAVADHMGLPLAVTWFESEQEEEGSPVKEAHAMLSHGLCDLVPSFALYASALDGVAGGRGALPRWDDRPAWMGPGDMVDLEPIAVTAPYIRMEMGVVSRGDDGPEALSDLAGTRVGIEQGTLAGAVTLRQAGAEVVAGAVTANPGPSFLWEMEQGAFDAALVTVAAWDAHRKQNPVTALRLTDYRHPIGFNLGMAAGAEATGLVAAVDAALAQLDLAAIAEAQGVTWAAPTEPAVAPALTMRDIAGTGLTQ